MSQSDRFSRQRVLPEIGEAGQLRLHAARFCANRAHSPWAQALAQRYALASGFGSIETQPAEAQPEERAPEVPPALFRHSASADVGLAAWSVLAHSLPLFQPLPAED